MIINKKIISLLVTGFAFSSLITTVSASNVGFNFYLLDPINKTEQKTGAYAKDDNDKHFYVKLKYSDIFSGDECYVFTYKQNSDVKESKEIKVKPSWADGETKILDYKWGSKVKEGSMIQLASRSDKYFCCFSGKWCP